MFARGFLAACAGALLMLLATASSTAADELGDFRAALDETTDAYNSAMAILQTRGQDETAAAVHRLRARWQTMAERFAGRRPAAFADDENFTAMFMQIDMSLVGVLLVIDLGNRDGAKAALTQVGEALAQLAQRSAAPR
jgi:hypothetical protein